MQSFLNQNRSSGLLVHIASLPGPFGIGDIGESSYQFIDFLDRAGQQYWQILPTTPTNLHFDSSPYMSTSAFAGSPLLISPRSLVEDGLLEPGDISKIPGFSAYSTNYSRVSEFKQKLLSISFHNFSTAYDRHYLDFIRRTAWLNDYALFMTLKEVYADAPWYEWPESLARREPTALAEAEERYGDRIDYYLFEQYIFFRQWAKMRQYAHLKNVSLIGDIPIYVGLDSSDVWANQNIFELDDTTLRPIRVSGVPPDYFSETGQRWGNPLYRWNDKDPDIQRSLISWWIDRFRSVFSMVDVTRVDHFRGFESYWAVPEEEETALNGVWVEGPGAAFFNDVYKELGRLNIIAEDLGEITPDVIKLRDDLGFPGMKVLQFAFDDNPENTFLPYNYENSNCVVYTGTHDNDTTMGWFLSDMLSDAQRNVVKLFANRQMHDQSPINNDLVYLAFSSIAALAVIPLQDLLGFGSDCRLNTPGVPEGNWRWRCHDKYLTDELADRFKALTVRFNRAANEGSKQQSLEQKESSDSPQWDTQNSIAKTED